MAELNLSQELKARLPADILDLLQAAAAAAAARGWRLYLVGGAVRDLILGRPGLDLDLSVEGDAIELAKALAMAPGDVTVHHRFNTARLFWGGYVIDIARSRQETYPRPGALPSTRPGAIIQDLSRRDFSVNAMAVSLNPDDFGSLIDPCGGRADLDLKVIRVLHDRSFIDDATRLWRGVRYEQRLGCIIEPVTLDLFQRGLPQLETITADRLRYELECVLKEPAPEKVFRRADELGLLRTWHPALQGDEWLSEACSRLRLMTEKPPPEAYLALLTWRLDASNREEFIGRLRLTKHQTRVVHDAGTLARAEAALTAAETKPSMVYRLLQSLNDDTLTAALAVFGYGAVNNIRRFMDEWRLVVPDLTGEDLKRLGVSRGPDIKRLLEELREQRLDGAIRTRNAEESFVRDWLSGR